MPSSLFISYSQKALAHGATHAQVINVSDIAFHPELLDSCKQNYCGNYGRCWTCPPLVGEVDDLIQDLKHYQYALVFQTISSLEDSFDLEGMNKALKTHHQVVRNLRTYFKGILGDNLRILGAGGCLLCPTCAAVTKEPCRFPNEALASVESHGIYVSKLAETAQMNYINGPNTVTYFGTIFFS